MMRWLREKYPETPFFFHDACIGGTGSMLALFRLDRDVLVHQPDLVFLDFTVNDGAEGVDIQNLASYEQVLRRLLASGAAVLSVLMAFKGHVTQPSDPIPPRHREHLRLAEHYGLPAANVLGHLRARVRAGAIQPDSIWCINRDAAHPDDSGYALFFEAVRNCYEQSLSEDPHPVMGEPVFENLYPRHHRHVLMDHPLPQGWSRAKTYRTSLWYDGLPSRWMGDVACASAQIQASPLEIGFEGSMVAIFGERNGFTPPVRIWIDGVAIPPPKASPGDFLWKLDTSLYAPPKKGSGNLFLWQTLSRDLPEGKHCLRIEPVFQGAAPEAELHLESICSAGR